MAHRDYMKRAVELAELAYKMGEVPVGAVVVYKGQIIGEGYNRRETDNSATAHAEIIAIEEACRYLKSWRLEDCVLYVTLEPCAMCTGAIINSRIKMVVYSLIDFKAGAMGGLCDLTQLKFNHKPEVIMGVMEEEAKEILDRFFKKLREKK